jgi:hypothetical protein
MAQHRAPTANRKRDLAVSWDLLVESQHRKFEFVRSFLCVPIRGPERTVGGVNGICLWKVESSPTCILRIRECREFCELSFTIMRGPGQHAYPESEFGTLKRKRYLFGVAKSLDGEPRLATFDCKRQRKQRKYTIDKRFRCVLRKK